MALPSGWGEVITREAGRKIGKVSGEVRLGKELGGLEESNLRKTGTMAYGEKERRTKQKAKQ